MKSSSASAPTLDPQRDSVFTKGPSDVLDHATSEIASGSKLGIDATKKLPGEGFKRPWPPLIRMSDEVRRKIDPFVGRTGHSLMITDSELRKAYESHHAELSDFIAAAMKVFANKELS